MKQKFASLALVGIVGVNFVSTPKLAAFWDSWQEKVEQRLEKRLEKQTPGIGIPERTEVRLEKFLGRRAIVASGKVTAKEGTSLIVLADGKTYTVLTDDKTKFRRKFWGQSSLDEIAVGDLVSVIGKWNNEERTEIRAILIRNLSVQKRRGAFFGKIKSVADSGFVLETAKKANLTVTIDASTKLVNRKMETITLADIKVGHRVRVKGLWDSINKTITEVKEVKNFSIPPVPSPSPQAE